MFFRFVFKDAVCLMFGPFSPHFRTVSAIWGSLFGALGTILRALGVILGALGAHLGTFGGLGSSFRRVVSKNLPDPNSAARFLSPKWANWAKVAPKLEPNM